MGDLAVELASRIPSIDRCADLLSELVRRYSPSGEEQAVQQFVYDWLTMRQIRAEFQTVADGLLNVVATVQGSGPGPTLLFCGHTDTALPVAGWETEPTRPTRRGDRLYGLGAMDMKSGVAAAMLTLEALAQCRHLWQGTIVLAAVADEEAYSRGAKGLISAGLKADAAVICEPSFQRPQLGGVGKVLIDVEVLGKAAHGSWPERGINAVVEAGKLLAALDRLPMKSHPLIGNGSQCVLGIHGGPEQYVIQVPERCQFSINRHVVPGETDESVLADMEDLVHSLLSPAKFRITIAPPYYPPFLVGAEEPFVQQFSAAFQKVFRRPPDYAYSRGVSDANYLVADAGIPTVTFGPSGQHLHECNEFANLSEMPDAIRVYLNLAKGILG